MSAPENHPDFPASPPWLRHLWWVALLAALGLLWLSTQRGIERVQAFSDLPSWSTDAPELDPSSLTGFENGQRQLIIPGHHNPSFWWITETQLAAREGGLRFKQIGYDSAPEQRPLIRTSPYRWYLLSVGRLHHLLTGQSLGYSIEQASLYADPLLLALLLVGTATLCARYLGSSSAIAVSLAGICLFPFSAAFQAGSPDQHSLAWALSLGFALCLFIAVLRPEKSLPLVLSALFGGLAFWNDATSQGPTLIAILTGAALFELTSGNRGDSAATPPVNWRLWGRIGSGFTLLASLFAFAPEGFPFDLDAVHPIHAAAWWGAAELLAACSSFFKNGKPALTRSFWILGASGLAALLAWPLWGVITESGALLADDFYARQIANHPAGGLGANLSVWLSKAEPSARLATLLPCLLMGVLFLQFFLSSSTREKRGRLLLVFIPLLFTFLLSFLQLRWWNLFDAFVIAALALLCAPQSSSRRSFVWKPLLLCLLVAPGLLVALPKPFQKSELENPSPAIAQALIARDFSHWLAKRAQSETVTVFSTPIFSGAMGYYGGFRSLTSADERNEEGFSAAVRIAAADSEQEVSILLDSREVTHVVVPRWDLMMQKLIRLGSGLADHQELPPATFANALYAWDIPAWLAPMSYEIPQTDGLKGFSLQAFERGPVLDEDEALSRLADHFVEQRQLPLAEEIRKTLADYPRSVHALAATAYIDYALGNTQAFAESMETLIPYLSRRAARDLPANRHITIASLLLRDKETELAKTQIERCLENIDTAEIKSLSPLNLAGLVALSKAFQLPFPDEETKALALELLSPEARARFEN
ncbi:hypothetical protein [Pelagicoccus sp. SDUM812003]|uniref:tetratricopeptide repeat protein n=1 Tax=Pelagicoccus sp. SDUM812003 TaxID=3041267 RepID=UPI00280EFBD6|nr:hypothetical protein [Pelagicoccus sp. SDUM812003]MDQ8203897.1 hypothetical protein [Pelagicoccus sp. SDUM812003]